MTWPTTFDAPTREGLVLVPTQDALIQDLGAFRSGLQMETDILPQSGVVCASENGEPKLDGGGRIRFAFEGNAIQAVNLQRYHERVRCAAGRLVQRAPSIAYGHAPVEQLKPVARHDLLRNIFVEILDQSALEAWSGERLAEILPPSDLETPTSDPDVVGPLCRLPMDTVYQSAGTTIGWSLLDGTLLTINEKGPVMAWRPGDPGLDEHLKNDGVEPALRMILTSVGEGEVAASGPGLR